MLLAAPEKVIARVPLQHIRLCSWLISGMIFEVVAARVPQKHILVVRSRHFEKTGSFAPPILAALGQLLGAAVAPWGGS